MTHFTDAIVGEAWQPDPPEGRHEDVFADALFASQIASAGVDFSEFCPPVGNQSRGGSCVLWAMSGIVYARQAKGSEFAPPVPVEERQRMGIMRPWRLCREEAESAHLNTGTTNRRAARILAQKGFCPERFDPYRWANFGMPPSVEADHYSADQTAVNAVLKGRAPLVLARLPKRVDEDRHTAVLKALSSGNCVGFGMTLPERFKDDDAVDWEKPFDLIPGEPMGGGHAMFAYGFDAHGNVMVQNSWDVDNHIEGRLTMAPTTVNAWRDCMICLSAPRYLV